MFLLIWEKLGEISKKMRPVSSDTGFFCYISERDVKVIKEISFQGIDQRQTI